MIGIELVPVLSEWVFLMGWRAQRIVLESFLIVLSTGTKLCLVCGALLFGERVGDTVVERIVGLGWSTAQRLMHDRCHLGLIAVVAESALISST